MRCEDCHWGIPCEHAQCDVVKAIINKGGGRLTREERDKLAGIEVDPIPDDPIKPAHYTDMPTGYAPVDICEAHGLAFNLGNAIKYILRAGRKGDALIDLRKAAWYLDREINRQSKGDE